MSTSPTSFQTVRLTKGAHRGPEHGVCVMELASMLAGEPFSDRPRCVGKVIAAFLRAYNDSVDDARRADLYTCASRVVGSAEPERTHERAQLCADVLADAITRIPRWRRVIGSCSTQPMHAIPMNATDIAAETGRVLARCPGGHEQALALVDRLVAAGAPASSVSLGGRARFEAPSERASTAS